MVYKDRECKLLATTWALKTLMKQILSLNLGLLGLLKQHVGTVSIQGMQNELNGKGSLQRARI